MYQFINIKEFIIMIEDQIFKEIKQDKVMVYYLKRQKEINKYLCFKNIRYI